MLAKNATSIVNFSRVSVLVPRSDASESPARAAESAVGHERGSASAVRLGSTLLCLISGVAVARAQSFSGIGDLAGGAFESEAYGVSADGRTVVGRSRSAAGWEAVRWRDNTLISLGDLPGGPVESYARSANFDGSLLIGTARDASTSRAVRWDGTAMTQLPHASGLAGYSAGMSVSSNGRTLCGFDTDGLITGYSNVAAIRIDDGVLTALPYGVSFSDSGAYWSNEDGRVLGGRVRLGSVNYQACFWTDSTLTLLPQLPGGAVYSQCLAVSGDGAVKVGVSCSTASPTGLVGESCRWQNGVAQSLGALPGASNVGNARSCNRDGSVVVGEAASTAGTRAYIWTAAQGMRELRSVLVSDYGLNLTGWTLTYALEITPDGSVIVGIGTNPAGQSEGWIARLTCSSFASYCTAGTTSSGCHAKVWAQGAPSASGAGSFLLTVTGVEGQKQGLFFYGVSGTQALPWSGTASWLCVKAPTQRMAPQSSGGTAGACDGVLASDWNAFLTAYPNVLGTPFAAGDKVQAQAWFRDPPSAKTTGLSNGLSFVLCP